MTEAQYEEFDDEETCELLDFVDGLNFDEYIQDVEFRNALAAVKGRARKLDKEQDQFKDLLCAQFNDAEDGEDLGPPSPARHETASQAARRRDPDGMSVASEAPSETPSQKVLAERILKDNPEMRAVHSAASVQKILEKTQKVQEA